uniref:Uncharacterized protein n=1 Tax=Hucho hucho TaxID=62062 RepID=A0A4W5QAN6_9TELE
MFSEAIHCNPKDHRFFGNGSYCYWCLELYPSVLSDTQKSIQLTPDWTKGYFRKGSALIEGQCLSSLLSMWTLLCVCL